MKNSALKPSPDQNKSALSNYCQLGNLTQQEDKNAVEILEYKTTTPWV